MQKFLETNIPRNRSSRPNSLSENKVPGSNVSRSKSITSKSSMVLLKLSLPEVIWPGIEKAW